MTTDTPVCFEAKSSMEIVGFDLARRTAEKAYKMTGYSPKDI